MTVFKCELFILPCCIIGCGANPPGAAAAAAGGPGGP